MKKVIDNQLWIEKASDGYRVGLTSKSQEDLGKITFVTLPKVDSKLEKEQAFTEVEAEKAVSEFVSPVSGTVSAINEAALNAPEILDGSEAEAWLVTLTDVSEQEFAQL